MTFGTPAYMAPEQIASAHVSGKADQFSLGVMAYEALGGTKPFVADTSPGLIHQIISAEPPQLHIVIPAGASPVVRKALAKNPDDRFPTCVEFIRSLQEVMQPAAGAPSVEAPRPEPGSDAGNVRKWRLAALAAVGLSAAAAIWLWTQRSSPAPPPASIGLNEVDNNGQVQIRWNRNAPAVRAGTDAVLTIQDGGSPVTIQLDGARLHSGSVTYARHADRIQITLLIHEPDGEDVREGLILAWPTAPK